MTRRTLHFFRLTAAIAALALGAGSFEIDARPAAGRERAPALYAIRGARVMPVAGPAIDKATIVMRDGVIVDVGASATVPADAPAIDVPAGKGVAGERAIMENDLDNGRRFVDKWKPRLAEVRNARHRRMLDVVLGEVIEQTRFFELALAGRDDLLGRRMPGASTGDGVLPVRWMT